MRYIKTGDFLRVRISVTYQKTKTPVDLTGCSAFSQMRKTPGDELMAEGTVTIDAENGLITVYYASDQTENLEPGTYGYDVRFVSDDEVKTIYEEQLKFTAPYTEMNTEGD